MFSWFRRKSELEKLEEKYKALLAKAFEVSKINRKEGDRLMAEAEEIASLIDMQKKE